MLKALAIIASPRKNGNTFLIVEKIAKKLTSFGDLDVEYLFLSDMDLGPCKGCCACLTIGDNNCPNKDDRMLIEQKILASDAVIFASPVYAMNMTALMKNFMDRFAFTMHRPRFFNQCTMLVAVTGSIGLKETISSISQLKYSGFNIVQSIGLIAPKALLNPAIVDGKMIEKIEKAAEKFYKTIKKKSIIKPSFDTIMQFNSQQKMFAKLKEGMPCDWAYFDSNGWFNRNRNYYTQNAKISFGKNLLAKVITKFI